MLKQHLDRLYHDFNVPDSATDPIQIVRRFAARDDREIAGFVAASLAFGRVAGVMRSVDRTLAVMGPSPADYVRRFEPTRDARAFAPIVHRWIRGADIAALVGVMRRMVDTSGSIEGFFADGIAADAEDVGAALERFSTRALGFGVRSPGIGYFFPRPSAGSACKRLNLFLRWMVRRDALDLGVWTRVPAAKLIIPLDTHVIRVGRHLALTRYASPGWAMASDITASLRQLDPDDPVKYDYSLCHLGMNYPKDAALKSLLSTFGRPRRSRRPSARR
ncbi:MAG TPA: TIGR02757 family protein [Vicinamibacterales bacterium]|nr:TIGR02757 family protein [Vicinamibacterales bacterium]